MALYL